MTRQDIDITLPCTQRRQANREYVQAIKQVQAKTVFVNRFLQVLVSRGNDADINLDRLGTADAVDFALFQHLEQLGLQLQVEIADFIQEQGSAVGHFNLALLGSDGTGKRALLMAEQL